MSRITPKPPHGEGEPSSQGRGAAKGPATGDPDAKVGKASLQNRQRPLRWNRFPALPLSHLDDDSDHLIQIQGCITKNTSIPAGDQVMVAPEVTPSLYHPVGHQPSSFRRPEKSHFSIGIAVGRGVLDHNDLDSATIRKRVPHALSVDWHLEFAANLLGESEQGIPLRRVRRKRCR